MRQKNDINTRAMEINEQCPAPRNGCSSRTLQKAGKEIFKIARHAKNKLAHFFSAALFALLLLCLPYILQGSLII
jgi:hypothetical protein